MVLGGGGGLVQATLRSFCILVCSNRVTVGHFYCYTYVVVLWSLLKHNMLHGCCTIPLFKVVVVICYMGQRGLVACNSRLICLEWEEPKGVDEKGFGLRGCSTPAHSGNAPRDIGILLHHALLLPSAARCTNGLAGPRIQQLPGDTPPQGTQGQPGGVPAARQCMLWARHPQTEGCNCKHCTVRREWWPKRASVGH